MAAKSPEAIEHRRQACRDYYAQNREAMRAQQASYRERTKEEKAAADAAYYEQNGERVRQRLRDSYAALSTEERRERGRRARGTRDPETVRREKRDEWSRVRLEVIQGYGGHCACCGNDHMPHLTLDHVGGGGAQNRRVESNRSLYRRLRREGFPPGFRVLCFNCNYAAHLNGGECDCGLTVTREGVIEGHGCVS